MEYKTTHDFFDKHLNASPAGALSHIFIIESLNKYIEALLDENKINPACVNKLLNESGINAASWINCAKYMKRELKKLDQ